MKNPLTSAGIEPETFLFVAQRLNHCDTAVPAALTVVVKFSKELNNIYEKYQQSKKYRSAPKRIRGVYFFHFIRREETTVGRRFAISTPQKILGRIHAYRREGRSMWLCGREERRIHDFSGGRGGGELQMYTCKN